MSSLTLSYSNVGNHVGTHTYTFHAGINVLEGAEASGKTNLQDAALVATSGKGKLNAHMDRLPDGSFRALPAQVAQEGVGVLASSSKKESVVTSSAPAAPLDTLTSFLTGDGLVDPELADKARVRALFQLLPSAGTVATDDVVTLLGDAQTVTSLLPEGVDQYVGAQILGVKDSLKSRANAKALAAKTAAVEAAGAAKAYMRSLTEFVLPHPPTVPTCAESASPEEVQSRLQEVAGRLATVSLQASRRAKLEEIRDSMGTRPDLEPTLLQLNNATSEVATAASTVATIQAQLRDAQAALQVAEATKASLLLQAESLLTAQTKYDTQMVQFAEIESLPTSSDVAQVEKDVASLQTQYRAATEARAAFIAYETALAGYTTAVQQHKELQASEMRAALLASSESSQEKLWRKVSEGIEMRLGEVLSRKGIPAGLTVSDGRLYAAVEESGERVTRLFADPTKPHLSEGQQTRVMLDLALAAYPGRLVSLSPSWLASLSPARLTEYAAYAKERGVIVLSSRPTDAKTITVRSYPEG